ncbi:hypothetical protein ACFWBV_13250 [Streptomyces sp. NPDC060030]|uniref:hypothetical protein n=1 Tax=Streptomyces sp. NPDC060030 TaxID=3347042 RepID=UPI0036A60CF5
MSPDLFAEDFGETSFEVTDVGAVRATDAVGEVRDVRDGDCLLALRPVAVQAGGPAAARKQVQVQFQAPMEKSAMHAGGP